MPTGCNVSCRKIQYGHRRIYTLRGVAICLVLYQWWNCPDFNPSKPKRRNAFLPIKFCGRCQYPRLCHKSPSPSCRSMKNDFDLAKLKIYLQSAKQITALLRDNLTFPPLYRWNPTCTDTTGCQKESLYWLLWVSFRLSNACHHFRRFHNFSGWKM